MRISRVANAISFVCVWGCEPLDPPLDVQTEGAATETCCGGVGVCVQPGFVAVADGERLGQADCQADTLVCAPFAWLADPTRGPDSCRTPAGHEGRCLPGCLPELQPRLGSLTPQTCEAGYLCAPCYDPLTGEDTRACRFEPDPGPAEEPPVPVTSP